MHLKNKIEGEEAVASSFLFLKEMIEKDQIKNIAEAFIGDTGMFLVDVSVRPGNVIVVEVDSEEGVSIDDCISLSRNIESQLDRDVEDFELEVGSAGITSPFKIPRQYQKNIGNEVEVLTKNGQKLSGILKSSDEAGFVVVVTKMVKPEGAKKKVAMEEELPFAYDDVKYTKYLIRFK
ncbi:ribosome maturation factor RimP [Dysgonomonas hofstadii]|uniref:Ribosome maturation factor RimP n=2 Tax=Dysgonomonas hofstadii TaxID=637886 RepID=A0A840CKR2_9BACT|nr:ribosome maturation factor RimP [Dysgonomonas hofstadii]